MVDYLEKVLVTDVIAAGGDSVTVPFTIRGGKLQEDPTHGISVLFQSGDSLDDSFISSEYNLGGDNPFGRTRAEIGGGDLWIRRYSLEVGFFFISQKFGLRNKDDIREKADEYAHLVIGRIEHALRNVDRDRSAEAQAIRSIVDEFGEIYCWTELQDVKEIESGGPPSDYIWRVKVRFRVICQKP